MKPAPKLRRYISIALGGIILVMILAYSLLVYYSLSSTFTQMASYGLKLVARDFNRTYLKDASTPLPKTKYLSAYLDSKEIPIWFKSNYDVKTLSHGKLEMGSMMDPQIHNGEAFFFLAMRYDLYDHKRLYLIETFTEKDEIPGAFKNFLSAMYMTLGLGIGFILLVGFALRYFFHKISTPINALTAWSQDLDREKLEQPHPDFTFEEINQLADLIQNATGERHEALTREHHFLRNASHELRTPIAVIRANMDLLDRLKTDAEEKEKNAHRRVQRAVDNMHRLTETLLWLSRKEETMPAPEVIRIDRLVNELVRENRYLLSGKAVDVVLDMVAAEATLPRAALSIVLGNLIRNAFQYTAKGKIEILMTHKAVTITNRDHSPTEADPALSDRGFGLGLSLVEQISQKLNLPYENNSIEGGHEATLSFVGSTL